MANMTEEITPRAPLLPQVEHSLSKVSEEADQGARAVAREYARLMDDAQATGPLSKALALVSEAVEDALSDFGPRDQTRRQQLEDALTRVCSTLAEHSVASDLGPKLLATLTALGLTPAGRGEKSGAKAPLIPMANPLQKLRDEARTRHGRAG